LSLETEKGLPTCEIEFFPEDSDGTDEILPVCVPCDEVSGATVYRVSAKKKEEWLEQHRRAMHLYTGIPPPPGVFCPECAEMKGRSAGHAQERPEGLLPSAEGDQVSWDHTGPWPRGINGEVWSLNAVDEHTKWTESFPCSSKADTGRPVEEWVSLHGPVKVVQADNAPEFKMPGSAFRTAATRLQMRVRFSQPYHPATNGVIERANGTLQSNTRASMVGVDSRLWPFAARHVCHVRNRLPTRKRRSPFFMKFGREASRKKWRRFGCLAFAKVQNPDGKLGVRWQRGVFLGFAPRNSAFNIGLWKSDNRVRTGKKFQIIETVDAKFVENILIRDIDDLMGDKKISVTVPLPDSLGDSVSSVEDVTPLSESRPHTVVRSSSDGLFSKGDDGAAPRVDPAQKSKYPPGSHTGSHRPRPWPLRASPRRPSAPPLSPGPHSSPARSPATHRSHRGTSCAPGWGWFDFFFAPASFFLTVSVSNFFRGTAARKYTQSTSSASSDSAP